MMIEQEILKKETQAPVAVRSAQVDNNKHVIQKFLEAREDGTGPRTMVIGHRGGFIDGPENSMRCFNAAIAANIEGIEFDVSDFTTAFAIWPRIIYFASMAIKRLARANRNGLLEISEEFVDKVFSSLCRSGLAKTTSP